MYKRGDLVQVRGWGGETAVLRVWEVRRKGLLLSTEKGFNKLCRGQEAPIVGFPICDIVGLIKEEKISM